MTITEALSIPKGMSYDEYQKLLEEKEKIEKKISAMSNKIFDETDSLEVLSDEKGSERYNKHLQAKQKAEKKMDKMKTRLLEITNKISQ